MSGLGIFSGAAGVRDGTLRSGTAWLIPLTGPPGTTSTVQVRTLAPDGDDPGTDTPVSIPASGPRALHPAFEVSADGGTTWVRSGTLFTANGGNRTLLIRQTAAVPPGSYRLNLEAGTFAAGTRLGAPTGLALTPGGTSITASWTALGGVTGYEARIRVAAGTWGPWVFVSGTSHAFTGLSGGTTYEVAVRGLDARGAGAAATASGMEGLIYAQDFSALSEGATVHGFDGWTTDNTASATSNAQTIGGHRYIRCAVPSGQASSQARGQRTFDIATNTLDIEWAYFTSTAHLTVALGTGFPFVMQCAGSVQLWSGSAWQDAQTGLALSTRHIVRVRLTGGSNQVRIWVNGVDRGTFTASGNIPATLGGCYWGRNSFNSETGQTYAFGSVRLERP